MNSFSQIWIRVKKEIICDTFANNMYQPYAVLPQNIENDLQVTYFLSNIDVLVY